MIAAFLALLGLAFWISSRHQADPLPGFPRVVLWAWDRPEDLRFLKANSAAVAYLERTIFVGNGQVSARPRLQPLRVTPGTVLMPVVRVESSGGKLPYSPVFLDVLQPAIQAALHGALQIDFDAKESERQWYRELLISLQKAKVPVLITALESWCDGDTWIRDLPVVDATPMLFQMGAGERIPSDFSLSMCRSSVGVSINELPASVPRGRRVYFFDNHGWTREAYDIAIAQYRRWQ